MLAAALFACGEPGMAAATGGSGGSGLPLDLGWLATYAIATVILGVGILTLALIVVLSRTAGPKPVPVPAGATLSPDGFYWWDGASWRPTR